MNNSFINNVKTFDYNFITTSDDNWFVIDIETDNLYDKVTQIFCIVIYDVNRKSTYVYRPGTIDHGLQHLVKADVLIGHNIINYDLPVITKLYEQYTFESISVIDTLICSRLIYPKEELEKLDYDIYDQVPPGLKGSASLKAWGYRLSKNKIEFKDFSAYSKEMEMYCIQDVKVTYKLYEHIKNKHYPNTALKLEHKFANVINKQILTGFPFDIDKALNLIETLTIRKEELEKQLKQLFGSITEQEIFIPKVNNKSRGYVKGVPFTKTREIEFNPGSRQQIVERLKLKYGWEPKKTTEKGNPILNDDVLETLPFPEAKILAEYQLIKKRLGQISEGNNAWIKLFNTDTNSIHGNVITNGCITGRCSHQNPNMGQVPGAYSPYGKECRSLFHAPKGYVLIGIDAKALELRCLAGYLALWDNGEYANLVIDPDVDIHTYNQKQFGVSTRDISKRLLYACLYGAGVVKAGSIIDPNEKNTEVLKQLGSTAINSFLHGVPALKKLKQEIENTIMTRGYLIGLDRRQLYCRSMFKGLNVLLQSAGAIIMKQVVVMMYDNITKKLALEYNKDWMQHAMVHDEIQISCLPRHEETIKEIALKSFTEAGKYLGFGCKIEGEAKSGLTWYDTH
jgi:DNA polymerase I-like protein with 3'-5' exonuclease and polymerase domains